MSSAPPGFVRRSRLYYLRDLSGKKARLHSKVRDLSGLISEEEGEGIANASDLDEAAPVEETAAEIHAKAAAAEGDLKGKARKKAKAEDKAKRMVVLEAEAKARAEKKARDAEEAAKAAETKTE